MAGSLKEQCAARKRWRQEKLGVLDFNEAKLGVMSFQEEKAAWARKRLSQVRARASASKLNFNLSELYLKSIAPVCCPVFGEKLIYTSRGKMERLTASIDKIVPALGYVKGNVQVISMMANRLKSNASLEDLELFAKWINLNMVERVRSSKKNCALN